MEHSDEAAARAVAELLTDAGYDPSIAPQVVEAVRAADEGWNDAAPERMRAERLAAEQALPPAQREAARFMRVVTGILSVFEAQGIDSSAVWEGAASPTAAEDEALREYKDAEDATWPSHVVVGTDWTPNPSLGDDEEWRERFAGIVGALLRNARHPDWHENAPGLAASCEALLTDEDKSVLTEYARPIAAS